MAVKHSVKKIAKRVLKRNKGAEKNKIELEKLSHNALSEVREEYKDVDKDHLWAFVAGQASMDFRGNPKYLFVYINNYRPDIKAYWLCDDDETIKLVRDLGFKAYKASSIEAQYLTEKTGVIVAEQVKVTLPQGFHDVKYVNLWHGIGFKRIERGLFDGEIAMDIAKKYVDKGTFYRDHQLMLVTCPRIEEEFTNDTGTDEDKFVRAGYPRCLYQQNYKPIESYIHNLRALKGLPSDAKLVVYAPTYRAKLGGTFTKGFPDFDKLYDFCEKNNILFIFKVHPNMEKEVGFLKAWEKYGDRSHFFFWDNRNDFYEIMHEMDLAIIDYSAIFSDMVAMGIKKYIRYIYDYDEYNATVGTHEEKYFERTVGEVCYSFDDLLAAMESFEEKDYSEDLERINNELWSYSKGAEDFDNIIDKVFSFKPEEREFKTLYSFDVFDTLISRKVLHPHGIFYGVREKMIQDGGFSYALVQAYPHIRHTAEFNVREFYNKTKTLRNTQAVEISFDEIFHRIAEVYPLTEEQKQKLKDWELELELDNVIPVSENIERVKALMARGEEVILISDMYLPADFIKKLIAKADPEVAELPLFLSNDYGVQKTTQLLFFEVYKSFRPYYDFEKWIHTGDNPNADFNQPDKFKISVRRVEKPEFNDIQESIVEKVGTYDAFKVAALQARMIDRNYWDKDDFVVSFVSLCFVPYIDWVLRDAERRGYETLYFVSRDGYHLKRIADEIISSRGLNFKTKYIYGSRRLWRIPSYIDEIDPGFWEAYGNFNDVQSKDKLLKAMDISEEKFSEIFPYIDPETINYLDKEEMNSLVDIFRNSADYRSYLLNKAAEEREIVDAYFEQEIDKSESFAVVEYWGRGYNQECMVRLWRNLTGDSDASIPYYYARSIYSTDGGCIRHHFTTDNSSMFFIEAIFANMPYKSVEEYAYVDGKVEPVLVPVNYDVRLFDSMDRLLPEFAREYAKLDLMTPEDTDHLIYDFVFDYFKNNQEDPDFAEQIGTLLDSVSLYGKKREFAPGYTKKDLDMFRSGEFTRGQGIFTSNIAMSAVRTEDSVLREYKELYQILPGDKLNSGRVLTPEELKENKGFKDNLKKAKANALEFKELYNSEVEDSEVEDLILFVANGRTIINPTLRRVKNALKEGLAGDEYKGVEIEDVSVPASISSGEMKKVAARVARARIILASQPIALFSEISFRPETKEILLPGNPFYLYGQALDVKYFLKWKEKYRSFVGTNDVSVLQIPSAYSEDRYRRNFSHASSTDCGLRGCCNTDIYYEAKEKSVRKDLESLFPEAKGKKVILYMPTLRKSELCEDWADVLDLESLASMIGDEYVLVFNYNKDQLTKPYVNIAEVPGFSKTIIDEMSIRELLIAADVLVGDYRDGFFESALMEKPVFFTAWDYETICKARNVKVFDYTECLFGPIVHSSRELAEKLKDVEDYDYSRLHAFREKYMGDCDGHSTERVVDFILGSLKD